jgi:hypothetical protein
MDGDIHGTPFATDHIFDELERKLPTLLIR